MEAFQKIKLSTKINIYLIYTILKAKYDFVLSLINT